MTTPSAEAKPLPEVERYTFIMTHGFEPDGRVYKVMPKEPHKQVHPPERMVDAAVHDAHTTALKEAVRMLRERLQPFANLLLDDVEPTDSLQKQLQEWSRAARKALADTAQWEK